VRAFDPFPGASSVIGGEVVKLWAARADESHGDGGNAAPGTVLDAAPGGIRVATGAGQLIATELQRPGGKRLPAADFLRGFDLKAGQAFEI
jgi:methionyl-tRNA formyltransferase